MVTDAAVDMDMTSIIVSIDVVCFVVGDEGAEIGVAEGAGDDVAAKAGFDIGDERADAELVAVAGGSGGSFTDVLVAPVKVLVAPSPRRASDSYSKYPFRL